MPALRSGNTEDGFDDVQYANHRVAGRAHLFADQAGKYANFSCRDDCQREVIESSDSGYQVPAFAARLQPGTQGSPMSTKSTARRKDDPSIHTLQKAVAVRRTP